MRGGGGGSSSASRCACRAGQEHAVLADLADPLPVVVDVGDLASRADNHRVDGDAELVAYFLGGGCPCLAGDAGDQRERGVGARSRVETLWVASPTHVRQVRAGDGGGLVVKLRVPRWLGPFRSIRNDRG